MKEAEVSSVAKWQKGLVTMVNDGMIMIMEVGVWGLV